MADATEPRYAMRKRRRTAQDQGESESGLNRLLTAAAPASKIVIFSGSGLSATSGMSTFSTKGGLYERAQRKFKLQDGKTLFTYSFFDRNRLEAVAFFADIYLEATRASVAPGHHALAELHRAGRLQRHYTLNIDGLAEKVGMNTWHPEDNPDGCTVEMHGNVHHLVCVECGECSPLTAERIKNMKACREIPCCTCPSGNTTEAGIDSQEVKDEKVDDDAAAATTAGEILKNEINDTKPSLRFKVMLYEDADSEVITPEEVMDLMEEDTKAADLILWVGISFQQSASTAYFRKVRHWLQEAGKSERVVQAVINPSDEALWNLMTASSNQQELNVVEVLASSDEVLPMLARHVTGTGAIARAETDAVQILEPEAVHILEEEQKGTEALMSHQEDTNAAPIINSGLFNVFKHLEEERDEELAVPRAELENGKGENDALADVAVAAVHATRIEEDVAKDEVYMNTVQGIAVEIGDNNKMQERKCSTSPPRVET